MEPGETPEATVRRETREETGVELGPIRLFAAQRIEIGAPCPANYPYPYPVSYQVFYCGSIVRMGPFQPNGEVSERGLFAPKQARLLGWVQKHTRMYETARRLAGE